MEEPAQPSPPSGQPFNYPPDKNRYARGGIIGTAAGATVYDARSIPTPGTGETKVPLTIKVFQLDQVDDIPKLTQELQRAETCGDHENIVKVHCSFEFENQLWVVISNSGFVSLDSLMPSSGPCTGLSESAIAYILREILRGVDWIHNSCNVLHENLGLDCVFLNENSEVKLAFGSSSYTTKRNSRQVSSNNDQDDDPVWMLAPEVQKNLEQGMSSKEIDIWMFGLLALKLRYGRVPARDSQHFELLIRVIELDFGPCSWKVLIRFLGRIANCSCFGGHSGEGISKPFGEVLSACLAQEPEKRPTARELLEYEFFKDCRSYTGQSLKDRLLDRPSWPRRARINTEEATTSSSRAGHGNTAGTSNPASTLFEISRDPTGDHGYTRRGLRHHSKPSRRRRHRSGHHGHDGGYYSA